MLAIAGLAALAYRETAHAAREREAVVAIHDVRDAIATLWLGIREAEAQARGYMLTGQPKFLPFIADARQQVHTSAVRLRVLLRDEPDQRRRLDDVDRLVTECFSALTAAVELRRRAGLDSAAAIVSRGEGARLTEALRAAIRGLDHEEARLLLARNAAADRASSRTRDRALQLSVGLGTLLLLALIRILTELTRRQRIEAELREREKSLHLSVAGSDDGHWDLNVETRSVTYSSRWKSMLGYADHEIGNRLDEWETRLHPEDRERAEAALRAYVDGESDTYRVEYRLRHRDGTYRWILTRGSAERDEHRRVRRMAGSHTDITERRRAEAAVAEARDFYLRQLEEFPTSIWRLDADGSCDYVNRTWLRFRGRPIESELGHGWLDGVHPHDRETARDTFQRAFDAREPVEFECRFLHADGQYRWVLDSGIPYYDDSGRFAGYLGTAQDITARHESNERFHSAFESAATGIALLSLDGRWMQVNPALCRFLGYGEAELLQTTHAELSHPDDLATERPLLEELASGARQGFQLEKRYAHRNGRWVWGVVSATVVRDAERAPRYLVVQVKDANDRKLLEARLEAQRLELLRSNAELESFASVASHDLQEPLRKIRSFGDRLKDRCRHELSEEGQRYVDFMTDAAERMQQLILDLLVYSRISAGGLAAVRVSLGQLAEAVARDLETRLSDSGGRIEIGALPEIDADPTQMRQLLQNLIANALKFRRPGVPPVVTLSAEPLREGRSARGEPARYRLSVADNGIGFEERYLDRIFTPFEQLHGRAEYEGTGMGLAICRKIAERHGGTITARSTPGAGSCFIVTLPVTLSREETAV